MVFEELLESFVGGRGVMYRHPTRRGVETDSRPRLSQILATLDSPTEINKGVNF